MWPWDWRLVNDLRSVFGSHTHLLSPGSDWPLRSGEPWNSRLSGETWETPLTLHTVPKIRSELQHAKLFYYNILNTLLCVCVYYHHEAFCAAGTKDTGCLYVFVEAGDFSTFVPLTPVQSHLDPTQPWQACWTGNQWHMRDIKSLKKGQSNQRFHAITNKPSRGTHTGLHRIKKYLTWQLYKKIYCFVCKSNTENILKNTDTKKVTMHKLIFAFSILYYW